MRYGSLLKANFKKQKGAFAGITVLMMIITVSLCMVLSILQTSSVYEHEELERLGYGDLTSWVKGIADTREVVSQLKAVADTEKVEVQPILYSKYTINNQQTNDTGLLSVYDPAQYDYRIFKSDLSGSVEQPTTLNKGEIYVSPGFQSLFDAEIGDQVTIRINEQGTKETFTIKGFFEDPVMGSSVMGMKTLLISDQDYRRLENLADADPQFLSAGAMLHIFQDSKSKLSLNEFQTLLNEKTDIKEYTAFMYQKSTILGFMLILQNIFAGMLFLFILILLIATIIVIGHNITSSIEQDYENMGILKAIGYTKHKLMLLQVSHYLCMLLCGMLIGIPLSVVLTKTVNQATLTATGLLIPSRFPIGLCLGSLLALLLFLMVFVYQKTRRIEKISPIRAIRGGQEDIYFQSRLNMPIQQKFIGFWIALRQLTSHKKPYISSCLITIVMVFFLSTVSRLGSWAGEDGKNLANAFSPASSDMGLKVAQNTSLEDVENIIIKYSSIKSTYEFANGKGAANNINYIMNVISDPNAYHLLEGSTCQYANEVLLTEFSAKELDVGIGDMITLSYGENSAEYLVSGINQCANDMGSNFSISEEGFARLSDQKLEYTTYYLLEDPSKVSKIEKALKEHFGKKVTLDDATWSGIENVITAMDTVSNIMYIIVMIFVFVTVVLSGSKLLFMERQNMGIYKAIGFTSRKLRMMFAIRFGIIAAIGSGLGILISMQLSDPIVAYAMRMFGISVFQTQLPLLDMLEPAAAVFALFVIFAYFSSRKIRKCDLTILITE